MTTVFSALPMPKGGHRFFRRPDVFKSGSSAAGVEGKTLTPVDELLTTDADVIEPDLADLNTALSTLVEIFPDVQEEVFREMLMNLSKVSRVEVVTEHILKDKGKWVNGRYRARNTNNGEDKVGSGSAQTKVVVEETFRSRKYREAVKQTFYQEFKGLSHSTIKAVLAEQNHSYTRARPVLQELAAQSWRHYLTNLWSKRRDTYTADGASHHLVEWRKVWTPSGDEQLQPFLQPTDSHELNAEIHAAFVQPILVKQKRTILERDLDLANRLNEEEAEENDAMFECECCYVSYTFELIAHCDSSCHFICFNCIRHAVNEALFGQGWARNISNKKLSIRCLAPSLDDCQGCIPAFLVRQALCSTGNEDGIWQKLEDRVTSENLTTSGLSLLRCPSCSYAEVDEASDINLKTVVMFAQAVAEYAARFCRLQFNLVLPELLGLAIFYGSMLVYPLLYASILLSSTLEPRDFAASRLRVSRRQRGLKFKCGSTACGVISCSLCFAPWIDPHVCHETTTMSLRHAIEAATTSAVKRTCPKCQLSFVKSSGCNKLVCNCGYAMCYVCRNEIGSEGYGHFCQHFRELGGRCKECDRCDLYIVEDEDAVVRRAAERAEKEWREREVQKNGASPLKFSQPDARGQQLSFVREEVLSGVKYDERWNAENILDWLLEALLV